ncbi:MAG TPA: STAS domain-containing protein [Patescibacteria group bacterium]|nr:STAS domain-containing protein [Patescibacteria group bacterium]
MKIQLKESGKKQVVELSGGMYVEDAAVLREELIKLIEAGHRDFVIRLDQVDYIDSSGLGVLVTILKRIRELDGKLVIGGVKGVVKTLFELTRLNRVFDLED